MKIILFLALVWTGLCANNYDISDSKLGPRFDGVGAISGGGATSRLLPSYKPSVLSDILDYLFLPNFGASLHWFKVEIGGEALATEGAESSHARTLQELQNNPNYKRGYEWMLMVEAKKRNPNIKLYGLSWTWPGYLGRGNPWGNVELTANYSLSWVMGAKKAYGLDIDVIGVWNERSYSTGYILALRRGLDAAGFKNTAILCDDSKYACAVDILKDKEFADAVTFVGGHDPPTPEATQTGKPVWFSEDFHQKGGEPGAAVWAHQINTRFIQYNMTATFAWNAIDSFYPGLSFDNTGLMNARCPWSGQYEVLATIWSTAHTTQFTQPGWFYLPLGTGSGLLKAGGSFVTYVDHKGGGKSDFTIVVEKFSKNGGISAETATMCLGGSLVWAIGTPLNVWTSSFQNGGSPHYFEKATSVTPDSSGCFNLNIPLNSLWTVTTLSQGSKGSHTIPSTCEPFPLPYSTTFESCTPPAEADYFSDVSGSWECVDGSGVHGIVMRLQTDSHPISWESAADTTPIGVFGDHYWSNTKVSVDVRLNSASDSFMLAVRANLANTTDHNALDLEYVFPGLWLSWDTTGTFTLSDQANQGKAILKGKLPKVPATGTWHTYVLSVRGDLLSALMDGVAIFTSVNVATHGQSGWVGYGALEWGHHPDFDNFAVETA
eukprot:TRINITY_DN7955_c0_g1_i1.p1 TRINITY_DN7955_c0_g1~~TRINITY_DN7955_c0_g1_i1.p1  ORF type:complete len:662 (-),score=121.20 TRINITY_DN7955_c0_g1_i1:13-1998(-)